MPFSLATSARFCATLLSARGRINFGDLAKRIRQGREQASCNAFFETSSFGRLALLVWTPIVVTALLSIALAAWRMNSKLLEESRVAEDSATLSRTAGRFIVTIVTNADPNSPQQPGTAMAEKEHWC